MAKNINHLQHVKSSVVENGLPKLPAPNVLVEGELAVNYATDKETISLKNSSGIVVTFSSDNYYSEKKLGSGFTGENSGRTVTQVIEDDELAISAALNDLNGRKLDMSAYTPTDLSNYYDKDEIDDFLYDFDQALNGKVSSITINNNTKASSNGNVNLGTVVSSMTVNGSAVTVTNGAAALTGLATASELLKYADKAEYNSSDKKIYFKNGDTTLSSMTIDATDFIKDGMVNEVKIDTPASGESSGVTCLIVTFNTDAGNEDIEIPLSRIFDSSLYYTKPEIDNVLGSGFTVSAVTSSVTDVFRENELIVASALNDLDGRKLDASAYTPTDLSDYYTRQEVNTMLGNDFIDFSGESFSSVTDIIRADETVTAAALNDLNERKLDASAYTPSEFTDLLDEKLGYWFSGDSLSSVTDVIRENEIIVSSALNDLDDRKLDASAFTESVGDFYTKEKVDDKLGEWFSGDTPISSVTEVIREDELAISAALNDLDDRKLDMSAYTPTDLSGYYTKQEIDEDKLGSGFTGENSGRTVTQAINETEIVVAAALTDLDDRKLDASAYTQPDLSDYATKEWIENDVLGSGFTGEYSGKSITEVIEENELIISSALNDLDERIIEISGNTGVGIIVSGEYSDGTLYLEKNDGTSIEVSGFTTGGGGGTGDLSGVTFNGVAATKSNGIAAITANVVSSVTMNSTNKSINNGAIDLGTVITAETQLSTATTGTGVVVTGLTVSNHKITTKMGNITLDNVADGSTRKLPTALSALTDDATHRLVTDTEKTNWNNAYTSAHSHSNKSVLDGITTAKTASWDTVTAKTDNSAFTAHTANTTAHITAADKSTWNGKQDAISDLASIRTSAATQSDWNATSGVAMIKNKPTIPAAANNATITLQFGNSSSAFTVNASSNLTINLATLIGIPAPTASDNGKILGVVNGQLAWVTPTTIYTGTGTPSSSQGNNGDIYLQTS